MKNLLFMLILAMISISIPAQAQFLEDIHGRPIRETRYTNVEGSPYLVDDWVEGVVKLKNGVSYKGIKLKYDQVAEELLFNHNGQALTFVDPVEEFKLTAGGSERVFRSGIIPNEKGHAFYEVLYDGGTKLVRKRLKQIVEHKPYNSATATKSFVPVEALYIVRGEQATKIKDKKSALAALSDKGPQVEGYVKDKKLNLKEEADLVKLVQYYNSL